MVALSCAGALELQKETIWSQLKLILFFFAESTCLTTGGKWQDKPCIFPFINEGVEYNECISYENGQHWCSTKVNKTGKNQITYDKRNQL